MSAKPYRPRFGAPLSRKQAAILTQIVDGQKVGEISEFSGMAPSTVAMHIARAKVKLGARTLAQAAVIFDRQRRSECSPGGTAVNAGATPGSASAE